MNYIMYKLIYVAVIVNVFFSCRGNKTKEVVSNKTSEIMIEKSNEHKSESKIVDNYFHLNISNENNYSELSIQETASNDYQAIRRFLGNGNSSQILKTDDYPSFYGGSFTNKQNQLVIFITGDTLKAKVLFSKITDNTNTIFRSCKYPYSTLIGIMDTISSGIKNKKIAFQYIDFWWIEEKENRVFVFLSKLNDEVITEFKQNIIDSHAIILKKSSDRIKYD